jgi:hypothetical protein
MAAGIAGLVMADDTAIGDPDAGMGTFGVAGAVP